MPGPDDRISRNYLTSNTPVPDPSDTPRTPQAPPDPKQRPWYGCSITLFEVIVMVAIIIIVDLVCTMQIATTSRHPFSKIGSSVVPMPQPGPASPPEAKPEQRPDR
jgi:hypothetical protein